MLQEYGSEAHSSALPIILSFMHRLQGLAASADVVKVKQHTFQLRRKLSKSFVAVIGSVCIGLPSFSVAEQSRSLVESVEKAILTHPEVQARFHDFLTTLEGQNIER